MHTANEIKALPRKDDSCGEFKPHLRRHDSTLLLVGTIVRFFTKYRQYLASERHVQRKNICAICRGPDLEPIL